MLLLDAGYIFNRAARTSHIMWCYVIPGLGLPIVLWLLSLRLFRTSSARSKAESAGGMLLVLPLLICIVSVIQDEMRMKGIKNHYATTCGMTLYKKQHSKGGEYIHFIFMAGGLRYASDNVETGSDTMTFNKIGAYNGFYMVAFDSTNPNNCFLDASSPCK